VDTSTREGALLRAFRLGRENEGVREAEA